MHKQTGMWRFRVLICNRVQDYSESRVCEVGSFWWNKFYMLERQDDVLIDCFKDLLHLWSESA